MASRPAGHGDDRPAPKGGGRGVGITVVGVAAWVGGLVGFYYGLDPSDSRVLLLGGFVASLLCGLLVARYWTLLLPLPFWLAVVVQEYLIDADYQEFAWWEYAILAAIGAGVMVLGFAAGLALADWLAGRSTAPEEGGPTRPRPW